MCAVVAAGLLAASPAAGDWRRVGGDDNNIALRSIATTGIGGVPHVAYADLSGQLRVARLSDDGAHWLPLGDAPVAPAAQRPTRPALLDAAGVPYVAWTERPDSGHSRIHVARFDAGTGTWSEPDAADLPINPPEDANDLLTLAFFDGQVYVAWTERHVGATPPAQLYVKRLVAGLWEQPVSGSLNADPQHGAQSPHLATSGGKLWVAWTELTPHGPDAETAELLVKRLSDDGTAWVEPAARPTPSDSNYGDVAGLSDGGGTPYLLYIQADAQGSTSLHVKRLAAGSPAWDAVGAELRAAPDSVVNDASIGSAGGVPYVAWGDRSGSALPPQAHVARLNASGDGWEEPVATSLNADPQHYAQSMAVTDNLPAPYVAWVELTAASVATVVRRLEPGVSPQAVDFGAPPLGTVAGPRPVVFTNLTTSPVHIAPAAVTVGGPDAAAFGISSDGCSSTTLARGESCAIGVAFTPQAPRAHQATLSLTADALGSPYTTSLSGTSPGPAPPTGAIGVSINGGAVFTNDPDVDIHLVWQLGDNMVLLSNDGGFVGAESVPVAEHVPWRLDSTGPERLPKTVYARFGAGSQTFTDDIILDETAPTLSSVTFAAKRRVRIAARDGTSGLRSYQLTGKKAHPGKRRAFHRTVRYTGKPRKLYVRVFDRAGNHSRWVRVKHKRRH